MVSKDLNPWIGSFHRQKVLLVNIWLFHSRSNEPVTGGLPADTSVETAFFFCWKKNTQCTQFTSLIKNKQHFYERIIDEILPNSDRH